MGIKGDLYAYLDQVGNCAMMRSVSAVTPDKIDARIQKCMSKLNCMFASFVTMSICYDDVILYIYIY